MNASTALLLAATTLASVHTHATTLQNGDTLTIDTGQYVYDSYGYQVGISSGSWYGIDTNGNSSISGTEKIQLAQGTTGLVIGRVNPPGASHSGEPLPGDTNEVTAPDVFYGNTGSWRFTIAPSGSTETGIDMSGWDWPWNGVPSIPNGTGAWQLSRGCESLGVCGHTFEDSVGWFRWDGIYGHSYTLDYTSTVPQGHPSGFGGVQFYTHLEGTVMPVPEPESLWLFGTALPLIAALARRRRRGMSPG